MSYVANVQIDQVAAAKFTVDREVKQSQVTSLVFVLKMYSNGLDVFRFERRLLANQLALIPRFL